MAAETATAETVETTTAATDNATVTAPDTSWQAAIPTDYAKDKVWEPYKSKGLGEVLKTHAEQAKLLGRSVQLPGKDAKPEEVAKVRTKLAEAGLVGAPPATPADYKFDRPKVAEALGWDEDAEQMMRGVWHKNGFTNDQVNALMVAYGEFGGKRLEAAERAVEATEQALKTEWGADYDATLGAAVRFVKATGEKYGIPAKLKTWGIGNDPDMIRWVADLAKGTGEHTVADTGTTGTTSTDFDRRHQELLTEMGKANPGSPRAVELQANLEALLKQRYPG